MNEILKPDLIWIEGRCYRVTDSQTEVSALHEHDLYENEITYQEDDDEKDEIDDCEIFMLDDSRYYTNFHIATYRVYASDTATKQARVKGILMTKDYYKLDEYFKDENAWTPYLGCIIGKKGGMKNRIERDTRTEIKIPRIGENKDIFVYGAGPGNIKAARRRINIIVMAARMKYKPTHFLSIPLNGSEIMRNFENFKTLVLNECSGRGLEDSLFIRPEKLHLTLGVTCLMDNEERLCASKLLTESKTTIIMPLIKNYLPLKIRLKGLSYMNDDPKEIDVLYGCVQEERAPTGLLQKVIDSLVEHFKKEGFMNDQHERENVKLHVTLLNSKYRKRQNDAADDETQSKNVKKSRETFDGSDILQKFSNHDFGVTELREIHLSQRKSMGSDGYYQSTCIISCNLSSD